MTPLDWDRATVLTLTEFEVCWSLLDIGETPGQIDPPSHGRTHEERRAVVASTLLRLRDRGLAGALGPHLELADRLHLLAAPDASIDVRLRATHPAAPVAGVAARRGSAGVLAVRHDGHVALLDLPAAATHTAPAELLGAVTPGPGRAVTVPAAALDCALRGAPRQPDGFARELTRSGIPDRDAQTLVAMCDGAGRRGQFGGARRRPDGRLRRADHVVGVHRTPAGDYLQLRRNRGRDGATVTVAPCDPNRLREHLGALVAR